MKTGVVVGAAAVDASSEGGVPPDGQIGDEGVPMGLAVAAKHGASALNVLGKWMGTSGFLPAPGATRLHSRLRTLPGRHDLMRAADGGHPHKSSSQVDSTGKP